MSIAQGKPILKVDMITIGMDASKLEGLALKPDENGFYRVPAASVNKCNDAGEFYSGHNAQEIFGEGSPFYKDLISGYINVEVDHPERKPGWTDEQWIARLFRYDSERCCGLVGGLELVETNEVEKGFTDKIIDIFVKVKPQGEKKQIFIDRLEDPHSNVALSMRVLKAMFNDKYGRKISIITAAAGFDLVWKPGISRANKYSAVGIEASKYTSIIEPAKLNALCCDESLLRKIGLENHTRSLKYVTDKMVELSRESNLQSPAYGW